MPLGTSGLNKPVTVRAKTESVKQGHPPLTGGFIAASSVYAFLDTGVNFMCVTVETELQIGLNIGQVSQQIVTPADWHQRKGPKIAPIEIAFENHSDVTESLRKNH